MLDMVRKGFDEHQAKRGLTQLGYEVKRKATYTKHTFQVELPVYKAFRSTAENQGYKVKDAVTEALADWVKKHSENS